MLSRGEALALTEDVNEDCFSMKGCIASECSSNAVPCMRLYSSAQFFYCNFVYR